MKATRRMVSGPLVVAALVALAACSPTAPTTSGAEPALSGAITPVAGCGPEAYSDPADRSPGQAVARCEPGAPAPQPLPERTTVTVSAQTLGEYFAPVLVGVAEGEFEKENLDVQLVQVPFSDALPQLASGSLDIAMGGPYASVVNAVNGGFEIQWVLGNFAPPHGGDLNTPQSGLWFRRDAFTDPANPSIANLANRTPLVANTQGSGTPAVLWMERAFRDGGIDFNAVQFQSLSPADQVVALRSGAVQGAYLLDPFWRELASDPAFVLLAVQPKEVNGGMFYGQSMLGEKSAAGLAFARAYIRTINTYLADDYKADEAVMSALAERMGVDLEIARRGEPLVFDWEVPVGLYSDLQELYLRYGTVQGMSAPLPEERLVNSEFYERAVGHVGTP